MLADYAAIRVVMRVRNEPSLGVCSMDPNLILDFYQPTTAGLQI